MTLNDLIIEMACRIRKDLTNSPGRFTNDVIQDTLSEMLTKRASKLRVALPNNQYSILSVPYGTSPVKTAVDLSTYFNTVNEIANRIHGDFVQYTGSLLPKPVVLKCECGAEKLGVMKHSDWCCKHTEE